VHIAIKFSVEQKNIADFSAYLEKIKFPCRLSEHNGEVVLWVYEESHIAMANELYRRFLFEPQFHSMPMPVEIVSNNALSLIAKCPLSLVLVLGSCLGFLVIAMQQITWFSLLSFQGFDVLANTITVHSGEEVHQQLMNGQIWRAITPIFLHFDIMHVTFNATIVWFLGSQIEKQEGTAMLLLYVCFLAIVSNGVQYYVFPERLFGGMSGVNYGVLAYCAVRNYSSLDAKPIFNLPLGLVIVSVVMMLLGFLNVFSLFNYSIANWAHLSGFIAGIFLAVIYYFKQKRIF
jgi:GlpG protein